LYELLVTIILGTDEKATLSNKVPIPSRHQSSDDLPTYTSNVKLDKTLKEKPRSLPKISKTPSQEGKQKYFNER
jgi:hypothetical protein